MLSNLNQRTKQKRKEELLHPEDPAFHQKVGDAGEKHVFDYEKNKLESKGRHDLADLIVKQYEDLSFPDMTFSLLMNQEIKFT